MIFDSQRAFRLLQKYAKYPDDFVPEFVVLARSSKYAYEREYIEGLVTQTHGSKQKDWIGRLANDKHEQFLAAWFEIMLYGWLQSIGAVTPQPDVADDSPDTVLSIEDMEIVFEAKALLISKEEREREQRESEVCWLLCRVQRPYLVDVPYAVFEGHLNGKRFIDAVTNWLDHSPQQVFEFRDGSSTVVRMAARRNPKLTSVTVDTPFPMERVDSDSIRAVLVKKSKQHKGVKAERLPFVVSVLLESHLLCPEQVVQNWLGKTVVGLNNKRRVTGQWVDRSGLVFAGTRILHTRVSGILVFQREWHEKYKRRVLKSWYVQNPFATVAIAPSIFPAEGRYVVLGYQMGWR